MNIRQVPSRIKEKYRLYNSDIRRMTCNISDLEAFDLELDQLGLHRPDVAMRRFDIFPLFLAGEFDKMRAMFPRIVEDDRRGYAEMTNYRARKRGSIIDEFGEGVSLIL